MSKDRVAVKAIRDAADAVARLRMELTPEHAVLIRYLYRLSSELLIKAQDLEERCEGESGG